jgi:endoribonuclease Nob1
MRGKVYILDASGIIGGFISQKHLNITTSAVLDEIKDLKSQMMVQSALQEGNLEIAEPNSEALRKVQKEVKISGDILRLSEVDKELVALAFFLKKNYNPQVVTDDYSMQNILKIMHISYCSILTEGINEIYGWIKICRGCRQKYPSDHEGDECETCGSALYRKKIKKAPVNRFEGHHRD